MKSSFSHHEQKNQQSERMHKPAYSLVYSSVWRKKNTSIEKRHIFPNKCQRLMPALLSSVVFSPLFTLLQSLFSTLSITILVAEPFLQHLSLWSCPLYTFFIAFFLQYSTHQVETRNTASVRTATAKVCKSSIKQRWRRIKRGRRKMVRESSVDYTFIVCYAK